MSGENEPTYTFNTDGSIDIPVEGKPTRFVKESDLLAVKGSSETKAREWETEKSGWEVEKTKFNTDLAEANRLRNESHTALLAEQAAREQLVTTYADYETHKTRVSELETEIGSHKESLGKQEIELTERIRQNLIQVYGASEDAVKDQTLDQLRNLETAAKIIGPKVIPAKYDGGPPGPGGGAPEAGLDRAKRILEEHDASGHKIGAK